MTTGPAPALLRRLGQYLDGFSACFSRQPQRDAASKYLEPCRVRKLRSACEGVLVKQSAESITAVDVSARVTEGLRATGGTRRTWRSVDDLVRVSGIGPARLQDIKAEGKACVR